ncbi:hypothetical protein KEM48_011944 [Puccinia striiformis f. sp. tritici PST-130]|nr:hypothetical protein KEM48_011944 [Puccinia striiformis f. sp. tritici PST-130]
MPPEVAQAFGRMSLFMKDISLITGHLANVMAFTPQESRSTSGQEDPPDESVASMDYHSVVQETPSAASDSPKAYHHTYSQYASLYGNTLGPCKSVINHEGIASKAYNPASSQSAPFAFGIHKPALAETPSSPSKLVINHEELNIESFGIQKPALTKTPSIPSQFAINHEGIESKASLPKSSPAPFTFGIQKPAPTEPLINIQEPNIGAKATYPQSSQSASFAFGHQKPIVNPFAVGIQKPASIETPSSPSKSAINHEGIESKASFPKCSPVPFTLGTKKPIVPETPLAACKSGINHEKLNHESKAPLPESSQSAFPASAPNETTASESTCPEELIATLDGLKVPSASPAFSAFLTKKSQSTFTTKHTNTNKPKPTPPTPKIQSQTPRPDLMVWTVYKDARYRITYLGQETKSIWLDMEFDGIRTCTIAFELESALVMMLEGLKKHAKMLPKSQRDGQPHLVSRDLSDKSHTAAIYYDGRVITSTGRSMSEAIERVKEMKQGYLSGRIPQLQRLYLKMPAHHHLDSPSHSPAMPLEVAQAFGRMSIFMKDISLITGHLANVMTFPPQESRSTSAQGNTADESFTASQDHHSTVKETPSAASDSAIYPEPRTEPKAYYPADPQSSNHSSAFANQKPALSKTPSTPCKFVINHEAIESKASLPDSSQPAPLMFGTKKPIVPETPSAACQSGINDEELNIEFESKASLLKSSQSASSASATKETTASESICPEKLIAIVDGLKLPSTSPGSSAFLTEKSQPDTMVWTVYKDARYRITYQNDKVVWLNMEFDGLRRSLITRELESALVITLEELKRQAKMLPKSLRDGEPHLVCRDLSDGTHAAAVYYDGRVITYSGRSTSEALGKVKEKKQSSIEFGRRCGYVAKP